MDTKERIIEGAKQLYWAQGIRNTTMNDVATELSVSKKTIYQHFKDKDELVYEVALKFLEADRQQLGKLKEMSSSAVEHLLFTRPSLWMCRNTIPRLGMNTCASKWISC